jgi:hypothetical protein
MEGERGASSILTSKSDPIGGVCAPSQHYVKSAFE